MALTSEDREALVAAKRRSPNSHWIVVAVEQIVARHVTEARAAALNEAAERLDEVTRTPRMWMAYPEAARIVRTLATTSPPARTRP